jgi:murein DD-endopeptidase MepM/ murein hydrolase activator NlpD
MKRNFPDSSSKHTLAPSPLQVGIILLLLIALVVLLSLDRCKPRREPDGAEPAPAAAGALGELPSEEAPPALRGMALPSPQQNLFEPGWEKGVQPTVSGRPESGLYGSSRTGSKGLASFHEGVDIAAVARDARGKPTDPVTAVSDGRVAYVNRVAGNSNYGIFVVLFHSDPAGVIYTLYAHLASVEAGVVVGREVSKGALLGILGHTPSATIPLDRAHLHFEVGLLANDRFPAWAVKAGLKDPHGNFNGRNLLGVDPLGVLADSAREPDFSMLKHLQSLPPAFSIVARGRGGMPDYFRRHPALWADAAPPGPALVWTCTNGGVPISGRNATAEEAARLGGGKAAVLSVDEEALGRNGRHLVVRRSAGWQLGQNGESWLGLLMF